MNKNVIGIRTNTWTLMEDRLYAKLLQYFSPENIFVIVDECNSLIKVPSFLNKISWNQKFVENELLLNYNHFNMGLGWLCGDYFYYAFRNNVKAEYYWLIEPDVLFSFENIKDFFLPFDLLPDDGIFVNTETLHKEHYWYESSKLINERNPMGCSFPLSRLSGKAIDLCKKERQRISKYYRDNNSFKFDNNPIGVHFPNDESLVINCLKREGLLVRDIKSIFPESVRFFGYHYWFSIPQKDILAFKNQVIHPARTIDKIKDNILKNLIKDINKYLDAHFITPDNISLLSSYIASDVGQYCREHLLNKSNLYQVTYISEKILEDDFIPGFKLVKQWIYDKKIVVFDFSYNDMNITFDFCINKDGNICCIIFERNQNDSKWINGLSQFLNLSLNGGRIALLENRTLENLECGLRSAIYDLSNYVNQTS